MIISTRLLLLIIVQIFVFQARYILAIASPLPPPYPLLDKGKFRASEASQGYVMELIRGRKMISIA